MSKQSKRWLRTIALFMSFVLIVYFTPVQGMAASADTPAAPDVSTDIASDSPTEETSATVMCEDVSLREENIKHFIMSNHTYRAVVYSTPVHHQQEGEWVDIDNTLTAQAATTEDDFSGQITTSGPFQVKFANNLNSSKLVRIDKDGYRLSWSYQSATKRNANGNVKASVKSGDVVMDAVANTSSAITYDYVEENASLEYEVTPTGVKENIIVLSAADTYTYSFEFKTKGVSLNPCDDGSIEVVADDTNEVVFVIPAPFMTDAAGRYSDAVSYSLSNINNNKATLTITADPSWINGEETQFPVIIDPIVLTEQNATEIKSTYVSSRHPQVNYSTLQHLRLVGYESSTYGITRTLIQFELPRLNKGDMVIGANLSMRMYRSSVVPGVDTRITAHIITEDWNASTTTWNNKPAYEAYAMDYSHINTDPNAIDRKIFDITRAVKGWYEGEANRGVLIKALNENVDSSGYFNSEFFGAEPVQDYKMPYIQIDYRSNKGLENYWSYTSISAGSAGTMHVNDYTGNPVFVAPLFTSPSEIMPLSLSAVYNGYVSEKGHVAGYKIATSDYSAKTLIGLGWRLSIQQTLLPSNKFGLTGETQELYPYVYTDADGTDHYFIKKTENGKTTYLDEDGLGLTLTIEDNADKHYYVTDKDDNVMIFNATGNLRRIANANGHRIDVSYLAASGDVRTGERIDYVVDGTNHKYTFNYSGTDNVQSISDHYGRQIQFVRATSGVLTKIKYYDGTESVFTYEDDDEDGKSYSMLTVVDDADYRLKFDYTAEAKGKRVSMVREYSANNDDGNRALGQTITFDRSKYNTTVIRTSGANDLFYTDEANGDEEDTDDILTTCQFDNAGRLISSYAKTAGGSYLGATTSKFTDYSNASVAKLKQQNRLLSGASYGRNVIDYITNSNFETNLSGWSTSKTSASATFGASSDHAYFGKKSAKLDVTAITAQTGRAMLLQDISGLTEGGTYTYSVYVKAENLEQIYDGSHVGAFVYLAAQDTSESCTVYSEHIAEDTNTAFDKGWKRLTATITLPDDCTKVRAYIQLRNMTGTVYADGAQFESGSYALPVNLIENAGFSKHSAGMPASWTANNVQYTTDNSDIVVEGIRTDVFHGDAPSFRILGEPDRDGVIEENDSDDPDEEDKYISQTINVSDDFNESYIVSGWATGHAISPANHRDALFEISVSVRYEVSEGVYRDEAKPSVMFNPSVTGWQYAAQAFPIASQKENHEEDTPISITLKVRYANQCNYMYFDRLQLIRDNTNTYTYDDEGNVISASANAAEKSTMQYEGSNLTSIEDKLGYGYTYTYFDNHNIRTAKSAGDVTTRFVYNDNNQLEFLRTENGNGLRMFLEKIVYTEEDGSIQAGAHVAAVADTNARETKYTYDSHERLHSVTTPDDNVITYSYQSASKDRVNCVTATNDYDEILGTVTYAYDGNRLNSLTYGDDTYTFEVDLFGNAKSTSINDKLLSVNTYAARNGKLKRVTYRNGAIRNYTYNWQGLLSTIKNGESTMYQYGYDYNGTLRQFIDNMAGRKTLYEQDSIGRPVRQRLLTLSGTHLGEVEYGYDERNNVSHLAVNFGGHTHTARYLSKEVSEIEGSDRYAAENLPTQYKYSSTRYANYEHTTLNLPRRRTFTTETPLINEYAYYASIRNDEGEVLYQTPQLKTETINGVVYKYSYDLSGNITKIQKGTLDNLVDYRRYAYDDLGQLRIEKLYNSSGTPTKTIEYIYDGDGNITSRTVGNDMVEYTYGTDADAGWSKMLKSYDGRNIDYDALGNPTYYLGADLTWDNGRQLKRYVDDDVTVAYTYDDEGMRTSKTVNGAKSTYLYLDGKLHGEVRDGHHIHYSYDSYGNLSVIKYYTNDTDFYIYYVMTNVFGDVISLHNANGTTKVTYEYDAWGNVISMTDSTSIGIGTINPIRYRGYYFDEETGLYYLASRYYDPETGRFINADGQLNADSMSGYNLFTYCYNNPISLCDNAGTRPILSMTVKDETPSERELSSVYMKGLSSSAQKSSNALSEDQKVFIATIAAEATTRADSKPVSTQARQAMANVIMNRIGKREWSDYSSATEICQYTGFDGYGDANYVNCMNYLNARDGNNSTYEQIIAEIIPIYNGDVVDITNGCQLYYTPAAMNPAGSQPSWNFDLLEEIQIPGVDNYYEGRFYKYK